MTAQRSTADDVRAAKSALIDRGLLRRLGEQPAWLSDEIDRSWRRSITSGANRAFGDFRYVNDFDSDSEFIRAARPALDRLEVILQDMGTAIFLADRTGQIIARRVTGAAERSRFDRACAAEGFDFSEDSIGTNGLGSPLVDGGAVFVRGAEHFNESLEGLTCAGLGIRHPANGRVIGSLSLSAPADAAELLMLAMVRDGVQQIVDNLSGAMGRREAALGQSYLRHRDKGPVIVLNSDTVMTNVTGLPFLNVEMHAKLWESLLACDWAQGPHVLDLDLENLRARVIAHRLPNDDDAFAVHILNRSAPNNRPRPAHSMAHPASLVDSLSHAVKQADDRGAFSVVGPSGSGKLHVVRAWLSARGTEDALLLDARELPAQHDWQREAKQALTEKRVVVLRHLEDLDERQVGAMQVLVDRATVGGAPRSGLVILTADPQHCSSIVLRVLSQVAVGVDVPPLRQRLDEIPSLVRSVLGSVDADRRPVLSTPTVQALMRWDWPGDVAELRQVLLGLAAELPGQTVSPFHLPERMWIAASQRSLSRIEASERTEILSALRQCDGNRSKAADLLGIGRTTLYRKIRSLGVDGKTLLN